jgi:hypothetical protein
VRIVVEHRPNRRFVSSDARRLQAPRDNAQTKSAIPLEVPPNGPQPAPDSSRQEKGSRDENPLEIERPKLPGVAHPMFEDHGAARIADKSLKRQDEQENVVDFSDERNEVRNEIHRQEDVANRAGYQKLVRRRDTGISK